MPKPLQDYDLCYQCGWLGLCTIACPLLDPVRMISPAISSAPGLGAEFEAVTFEITWEENSTESEPAQDEPPSDDLT